jgi:DinB family protein
MANITTPATSKELLRLVDEAWRPFRERVRDLGRGRIGEATGAGWTYRDLIAHVAAWEDLTARRLRALRTAGRLPGPGDEAALGVAAFRDADDFNARVVSSHRLVGAEALHDELDTAHRSLRSELEQLPDERLHEHDGMVIGMVAGNTYGHYAEHAAEISVG